MHSQYPPIATLSIIAILCACGGNREASTNDTVTNHTEFEQTNPPPVRTLPPDPMGRIVDSYFVTDHAPDPRACNTDDDCTYGGILDHSGCCWSYIDVNAAPMSRAYRAWTYARHNQCPNESCPPAPVPTAPPDCLFETHCVDARCTNECHH